MRKLKAVTLGARLLSLAACASTRVTDSWRDPQVASLSFKKVFVVFIDKNESVRRAAENELVKLMTNTQGVAAHALMEPEELKDVEKAKAKVKAEGFDGAVTMRIVSSEQKITYTPGMYPTAYYGFGGYYGYAWPAVYDPGYLTTDTIVRVETNVYDVAKDKLVWSGMSEAFNPSASAKLAGNVGRAVGTELRKQRLIQ